MALQTLDPLALSATKLQAGGMDAQEVAYKRKAMEDDLAKTQLAVAAKDRETAQKQKEADQKLALMPTYNTLSQQHTKFAFEWMAKEKETRAAEELAYRQGLGGNPNDPTTPEGLARWNRTVNYGQIAANSKQMESTGSEWLKLIAAHPTWYKPNAKDEIYKWQTSTEPLLTGEVANMPQELFDLQGAIATEFGKIEKEMQAWASADGTSSGTKEFIPSKAFLTTAEMFATEPNAQYALEQRFKEYTPEKQAQIDADAKKYGTNRNTAMAMDAAKALYDRTRRTAQSEQLSEGGAGRKDYDSGVNWLAELTKSVVEGSFKGEQGAFPAIGIGALGGATPLKGQEIAGGGKTPEENLKVFKGWTMKKQQTYINAGGAGGKKLAPNDIVVEQVAYDRDKGEWVLSTVASATGTKNTFRFANSEWESDVYPTLIAENKDKIQGIGGYVNTEQVSQNFEGKDAQNMAGAEKGVRKPAYQSETKTRGKAY